MLKAPKGIWSEPWSPARLRPDIAKLVARPLLVTSFAGKYGGSPLEYARKMPMAVNGAGATWVDTPYGPGMHFANPTVSAPTDYITSPSTGYPSTSATIVPHSIACLWSVDDLINNYCPYTTDNGGGGVFYFQNGGQFQVVHGGVIAFPGIGTVVAGNWFLSLYSYDLVTMRHYVINLNTGVIATQSIAETRALSGPTANPVFIGNKGAFECLRGTVAGFGWFRGAWTINEMEILARNPTAIWQRDKRVKYQRAAARMVKAGFDISKDVFWMSCGIALLPSVAGVQPVFDAAATQTEVGFNSPVTWNHTCTGTDRVLYVAVSTGYNNNSDITGCTYNGVAMTLIASVYETGLGTFPTQDKLYLFELINPPTGTHQVSLTVSPVSQTLSANSLSYTGVSQTKPRRGTPMQKIHDAAGGTSTSALVSVPYSSANKELVVVFVGHDCWDQNFTLQETATRTPNGITQRANVAVNTGFGDNTRTASGDNAPGFTPSDEDGWLALLFPSLFDDSLITVW